jgi:hypothetical protein
MDALEHALRHHEQLDAQGASTGELAADEGKDWILSARNLLRSGRGAANYGWRLPNGRPLQPIGPDARPPPHDDQHVDYSQVLRPIQRISAEGTDLLEVFVKRGLPPAEAERLR